MSCHLCEDQDGTTGGLFPQRTCLLCLSQVYPSIQGWALPAEGSRLLASPALLFSSCPESVCPFPDTQDIV